MGINELASLSAVEESTKEVFAVEERQQMHQAPNAALFRHRAICASCFGFAVLVMGLSTLDLKQLISRPATIDKSFKIKFGQLPDLPGRLNYSMSSDGVSRRDLRYVSENRAVVSEVSDNGEELFGFVDGDAKLIIKPQFNHVCNFREGLAAVETVVRENQFTAPPGASIYWGPWRFIDPSGKYAFERRFQSCSSFHNGVAAVVVNEGNGNYGALIDKTGRVIARTGSSELPVRIGSFYVVKTNIPFNAQKQNCTSLNLPEASTSLKILKPNPLLGLMDQHGHVVVKPEYEKIEPFINRSHSFIYGVNCGGYVSPNSDPSTMVSANKELFRVYKNFSYGLIDSSGKVLVPLKFQDINSYSDGVASVLIDGTVKLIDSNGNLLFERKYGSYDAIPRVDEPLIPIKEESGAWRVIRKDGKSAKTADFESPEFSASGKWFSDGLAPVCVGATSIGKSYGYIDAHGEMVIKPRFALATHFSEGIAAVWDGSAWAYIDKTGKIVSTKRFESVSPMLDGHAKVSVKGPLAFIVQPVSSDQSIPSNIQSEYEREFDESLQDKVISDEARSVELNQGP